MQGTPQVGVRNGRPPQQHVSCETSPERLPPAMCLALFNNLRKRRSSNSRRRANGRRLDPWWNTISRQRAKNSHRSYKPCSRPPLLNMWFLLWLHPPPFTHTNPRPSTTNLRTELFRVAVPSLVFLVFFLLRVCGGNGIALLWHQTLAGRIKSSNDAFWSNFSAQTFKC